MIELLPRCAPDPPSGQLATPGWSARRWGHDPATTRLYGRLKGW